MMEEADSSEMPVTTYETTRRHGPEDHSLFPLPSAFIRLMRGEYQRGFLLSRY